MTVQVSGEDVAQLFGSAGKAQGKLQRWKSRPGCEYVADEVLAHVSSAIFDIEPEAIQQLETEHPLGVLREEFDSTVRLIRDWRPDFAFAHLFHFCLEDLGRIYSWQEFRDDWCKVPSRRPWLWNPARDIQHQAANYLVHRKGLAEDRALVVAHDALQWRIGAFYYSFLREVYALSWLRRQSLPALSHPLADALFRADIWCGNSVVGIYIENPHYRSGPQGRKHPAQYYLEDQRRFSFVDLRMAKPGEFGTVALPTDDEMQICADTLRAQLRT
ncbi:hypothetical protein ABZ942_02055 [Nocardia sp. NPDC046473]|uniref:hypothetical protein n=1 Tax=Nocardia sp. NPDC046473 TaxID=3155733 RepID=UPI0033FA2484